MYLRIVNADDCGEGLCYQPTADDGRVALSLILQSGEAGNVITIIIALTIEDLSANLSYTMIIMTVI